MMKHRACTLFLLSVGAASLALAQTELGRITGAVTDLNGAVIPGARITVRNQKTGIEREVHANRQGDYIVNNLPAAHYSLTCAAPDLGPSEYRDISLAAGQERTVNLVLRPATLQQEVTVSAGELVVIDLSSARVGANVNEREVATLPLNGRQLSQLYLLAPGAQTAGGGSYDNIRFSGRANQQNAIRFDGIEASSIIDASPGNLNGETSTGFRLQSSLENVQEFRVESSNYPAEFGTGTAGQISVVTKSGGNQYHGTVFEYVRNDKLDARNFFDGVAKSPLRLNQFGGSIGGPIRKNKLFFFAGYEALRQRASQNIIEAVPSAAARARAVPAVRPLMDAYPTGVPTANPDLDLAQIVAGAPIDENYGSIRLDYRLNDKYSITARYFRDQGELISPLNVTGNYARTTAVPQNGMVSVQQILTPSMINEVKLGFNAAKTRYNGVAPSVNGLDLSSISIDFTGSAIVSGIGGQGAAAGAARIGGLVRSSSAQNGRAVPYTNYTATIADQLSWIKGSHALKFGVEVRPVRIYTDRLGGTTYSFSNLENLLANRPASVQVIGDVSAPNPLHGGITGNRYLKQAYYIGYVQDEWKIRSNLTMNYGLRYEYYSPLGEDRNLFTFFDMDRGDLDLNPSRAWYRSSKTNFGPRLAFTWAPQRFNNRTVFRIGAGYYYGPGQTEDQVQPIDSDRVTVTQTSNIAFPVNSQAIINTFDVNNLRNFAPRVYASGYTLPEKILSYTVSIQQQLPWETVLSAAYVGSQGRNLFLRSWTNLMTEVTMNPATGAGVPVLEFGNRFAQMDYKTSGGTDHYDSLQVTANRRFSQGLTAGAQWTWAHSLGNTGGSNEAQTQASPVNFELDRGNNAFDVRHSFNASVMYDLPVGRGRRALGNTSKLVDMLLGGWEVGGVVNARTGLPVDVTIARNDIAYRVNSTGAIVDAPVVSDGQVLTTPIVNNPYGGAFRSNRRPDVVPGVNPFLKNPHDKRVYLNPAAFAIPAPGAYGNLGRWALHGPGLAQVDFTLHKRFPVNERVNLEFRTEIYNVLNRANFANPSARLNNSLGVGTNRLQPGEPYTAAAAGGSFGLMTSTVTKDVGLGASRQVQLSLRLNF